MSFSGTPGPPGHRHAVGRARVRVGRAVVHATHAARGENRVACRDPVQAAADEIPRDDAGAAAVRDDEVERVELLVHRDLVLEQLLVQHVDQDVARDVGAEDRAWRAGGAEGALRDATVRRAREDRAHVLELVDVVRSLLAHDGDRVLVAEVVAALDGVERVPLGAVLGGVAEGRVDASLGRTRVGPRRVELRDHGHVGTRTSRLDRGPHSRKASADHHNVVPEHVLRPPLGSFRRAGRSTRTVLGHLGSRTCSGTWSIARHSGRIRQRPSRAATPTLRRQ